MGVCRLVGCYGVWGGGSHWVRYQVGGVALTGYGRRCAFTWRSIGGPRMSDGVWDTTYSYSWVACGVAWVRVLISAGIMKNVPREPDIFACVIQTSAGRTYSKKCETKRKQCAHGRSVQKSLGLICQRRSRRQLAGQWRQVAGRSRKGSQRLVGSSPLASSDSGEPI